MADTKYGHLVKKLSQWSRTDSWDRVGPGNADYLTWPKGSDLEGLNCNFSWGYYSRIGDWHTGSPGGHVHPVDECLVFVGLDPDNPHYLGAEIEIAMGKQYEKHVFSEPTVVVVPRGLPHCPLVTQKVEKPYGFYVIGLDAEHKTTQLPAPSGTETTSATGREKQYGHLIKPLRSFQTAEPGEARRRTGPGNADWLVWPKSRDLEGFILNFTWGFYSGLGNWHAPGRDPHTHVGDEFLVFVGLDPDNPDYLGAEIDFYLGKEEEKHVFNEPTVVIAPGGFLHAPVVTKKVDKTFGFYLIRLDEGGFPSDERVQGGL